LSLPESFAAAMAPDLIQINGTAAIAMAQAAEKDL
jgi:hypothetical protein